MKISLCGAIIAGVLFAAQAHCLELKSSAFPEGGEIPAKYTCTGEDLSPPLEWSGVPEGTESFVLIVDDPDAPIGTWIHWVVYDIPAASTGLEEGVPREMQLPDGTKQGINSFRWAGYGGPCPPPGPAHRYVFTLYAVDTLIDVPAASNKGTVLRAIQGHILGWAELKGVYGRK